MRDKRKRPRPRDRYAQTPRGASCGMPASRGPPGVDRRALSHSKLLDGLVAESRLFPARRGLVVIFTFGRGAADGAS